MRTRLLVWGLLIAPGLASAANLDVSASYRMRGASYKNLNLDASNPNNHSFLYNDARLGVAVHKIYLDGQSSDETSMDVGVLFHALGVAGSTLPLQNPLSQASAIYPNTSLSPFLENAYLRVHQIGGRPVETTFGRQTFRLGSGLLLDDDGAGLTGAVVRGDLPWWGMKTQGFIFEDKNPFHGAPNSLTLFGAGLDLPTEGLWQLSELVERDRSVQPIYGCRFIDRVTGNLAECQVAKAVRSFTSVHYQINYGPMVFDGEAALERGAATPTGSPEPSNHITFQGDAEVVRAKWKQHLYKTGEGIARLSVARGSGDRGNTLTTDEAFFPSHGHRFSGLERSGFGDFYGATPYDAFGGNYSTTTASGLKQGNSGIIVVGAGYTPPAFKGFILDIDYFLYQADRVETGSRTLGWEYDFRLRYAIQDHFTIAASAALFTAGTASNLSRGTSRKYALEASGRF